MTVKAKEELQKICQIIDQTIETEKIYLFGSYAYGVPSADSDLDICVIIPNDTIRPVDAVKKIRKALYTVQNIPMDVIVYRAEVFQQKQSGATLERKIAEEGVLLYERQTMEQSMV